MIGRADIEESKSNVAMNAWLPQASYPCGNFSDTSSLRRSGSKGSLGHAFTVCTRTESPDQESFCPYALREISVLTELSLGHTRTHSRTWYGQAHGLLARAYPPEAPQHPPHGACRPTASAPMQRGRPSRQARARSPAVAVAQPLAP